MASTPLSVLIPTSRRTPHQRMLLWGSAAASLMVLPLLGNLLAWLHQLPHWGPLERALATSPMTAWGLMLLWGMAVPLCVWARLRHGPGGRSGYAAVGAVAVALLWYVHMPAVQQCNTWYGLGGACRLVQAAHLLVAGAAAVASLFALTVLLLRSMGWVVLPQSDGDALDRHRYGV